VSNLAAVQSAFHAAVLSDDNGTLPSIVNTAERLAIYRNTVQGSLAQVLAAAYPVVRRIVGGDFFEDLCRRHIAASPPRRPHLSAYGADFPAFLASDPRLAELPYLPDTARLEWARGESYFAADAPALEPAALAEIAAEKLAETALILHPATRLIRSPFPVGRIWRVNQPDVAAVPAVDMNQPENVLISRPAMRVTLREIGPGDAAFIGAVAGGARLGDALARGHEEEPDFDFEAALRDHLISGSFTSLRA
jgi:hypothetical protein